MTDSASSPVVISETECLWMLGILGHKAAQDWSGRNTRDFLGYIVSGMTFVYDDRPDRLHTFELSQALQRAIQYDESKNMLKDTVDLYVRHMDLDYPEFITQCLVDTFHAISSRKVTLMPFVSERDPLYRQVDDLDANIPICVARNHLEEMKAHALRPAA